jgi:hypothetical protein
MYMRLKKHKNSLLKGNSSNSNSVLFFLSPQTKERKRNYLRLLTIENVLSQRLALFYLRKFLEYSQFTLERALMAILFSRHLNKLSKMRINVST